MDPATLWWYRQLERMLRALLNAASIPCDPSDPECDKTRAADLMYAIAWLEEHLNPDCRDIDSPDWGYGPLPNDYSELRRVVEFGICIGPVRSAVRQLFAHHAIHEGFPEPGFRRCHPDLGWHEGVEPYEDVPGYEDLRRELAGDDRWLLPPPPTAIEKLRSSQAILAAALLPYADFPDIETLEPTSPVTSDDGTPAAAAGVPQYVTLSQMAGLVHRSKKAAEKWRTRKRDPLPDPDIAGENGQPSEWDWEKVRPWLERNFKRTFSEQFPRM